MAEDLYPGTLGCRIKEKLMVKSNIKNQDTLTRFVCTFVFVLFSFFYLYYYQADLMTVIQHVLSKGQTHYNHFIGAVLIVLVLLLIQVGVVNLFRKMRVTWALTFVPSALCLLALTDVHTSFNDGNLEYGWWMYCLPVLMCVYYTLVLVSFKTGFSKVMCQLVKSPMRNLWVNLLAITICMVMVCAFGNSDKIYHARIHAEQCILKNNFDEALETLRLCDNADENTTMLTMYALSKKKMLPESLFCYRLKGNSKAMMPYGDELRFEIIPDSSFFSYLGTWYVQKMPAMKYLDYQLRHRRMTKVTADYLLCGYLLDKKLDAFANAIGRYYVVNDSVSLPKHYREALILYTHLHSAPKIVYNNDVMNADFQDYQKLGKSTSDDRVRKNLLRETYGNTYWYYYQYL